MENLNDYLSEKKTSGSVVVKLLHVDSVRQYVNAKGQNLSYVRCKVADASACAQLLVYNRDVHPLLVIEKGLRIKDPAIGSLENQIIVKQTTTAYRVKAPNIPLNVLQAAETVYDIPTRQISEIQTSDRKVWAIKGTISKVSIKYISFSAHPNQVHNETFYCQGRRHAYLGRLLILFSW